MSNKPFDLEKALAGEPILTRDRQKGYIKFVIENDKNYVERLVGVVHNGSVVEVEKWFPDGNVLTDDTAPNDIIGIWQEPRPRVQLDLPCPILNNPKTGDIVYTLVGYSYTDNGIPYIKEIKYNLKTEKFNALQSGLLFKSKEDAQEWLDAMRNARG